jgi:tyrosyl-tRNA synthetase
LIGASKREVEDVGRRLSGGDYHPAVAKRDLAERLVALYHSATAGQAARARFDRVFKDKDDPEDIVTVTMPPEVVQDGKVWVPRLLTALGLTTSNGEARRAMEQGGVRLRGELLRDPGAEIDAASLIGAVLQVGKRKFVKFE